jgi:RNA polymerase sigma-70 factor (ECF subfamily)
MRTLPVEPDDCTTIAILERIRGGDAAGFEELYRRYHDELLFVVRRRLGARLRDCLESEDVLQSVALEAFQALPRFVPRGDGSLRAFLHTLVLNKIRDRADTYGAQKRQGGIPLSDSIAQRLPADPGPEPAYFDDSYARLEQALARLPEDLRTVIVLRRIDGLSSKEIAARLGKSDAAVRKLASRAMARLALSSDDAEDHDPRAGEP